MPNPGTRQQPLRLVHTQDSGSPHPHPGHIVMRDLQRSIAIENAVDIDHAYNLGWRALCLRQSLMDSVGRRAALAWSATVVAIHLEYRACQANIQQLDKVIEEKLKAYGHLIPEGASLSPTYNIIEWRDKGMPSWTR